MNKLPSDIHDAILDFASGVAGVTAVKILTEQGHSSEEELAKETLELVNAYYALKKAIMDAIGIAE